MNFTYKARWVSCCCSPDSPWAAGFAKPTTVHDCAIDYGVAVRHPLCYGMGAGLFNRFKLNEEAYAEIRGELDRRAAITWRP